MRTVADEPRQSGGELRAAPARDGAVRALSGAWIGLALVLVVNRARVLAVAGAAGGASVPSPAWAPLFAYQDLLLVAALAAASTAVLRRLERPLLHVAVAGGAIVVAAACALYSAIATEVFAVLGTPLTGPLLGLSDGLRGVHASLLAAATPRLVATVVAAPAAVCAAAAWMHHRPAPVRPFGTKRPLVAAFAAGALLAVSKLPAPSSDTVVNPHVLLLASLLEGEPSTLPSLGAVPPAPFGAHGAKRSPSVLGGALAGSNVVLIVLESVGTRYLAPWGASLDVTPTLTGLAGNGVVFERVHAQQPRTSSAMAALFCSLAPWSRRQSIPRTAPDVAVPGLADVLAAAGYRTAFLHPGDLGFDRQNDFLLAHGFATVLDRGELVPVPAPSASASKGEGRPIDRRGAAAERRERRRTLRRERERLGQLDDRALVPPALAWLDRDPAKPFFLVLWTIQGHHPYVTVEPPQDLAPHDADLNRYLNALREDDRMLAQLLDGLRERGLLESTLVVVTGDHGEAFGEHGVRFHGRSLHDEEVHVPLVLSHPDLGGAARRIAAPGSQIDVPATLADLLGLALPERWQGASLFASDRSADVPLVNVFRDTTLGLVRDRRKYLFDERLAPIGLYDTAADPEERDDRSADPGESSAIAAARSDVAAWLRAQDAWLEQIVAHDERER